MLSVIDFVLPSEAQGFIFSSRENKGIAILRLQPPTTTSADRISLMFMTHENNGTLLRADGVRGDFIELKLVSFNFSGYSNYFSIAILCLMFMIV